MAVGTAIVPESQATKKHFLCIVPIPVKVFGVIIQGN